MKYRLPFVMAGLLLAAATFAQDEAAGGNSFFDALGASEGRIVLRAEKGPEGGEHYLRSVNNEQGELVRFVGKGRVILESPRLNLRANDLVYEASTGTLVATGDVEVDQKTVEATAERLEYDTATQTINLSGKPDVKQLTDTGSMHFAGMDNFTIVTLENGQTEVRMSGGDAIVAEMNSNPPAPGSPTPTPGSGPQASNAGRAGQGLGALGNNVHITTRTLKDKAPSVYVSTAADGTANIFRAEGSVVLVSETMNLRSDLLEYDAPKQSVEAVYNVYVKQNNIEADAGRMVYDLRKDEITLTVNPVVREQRENRILVISQMDSFIILRNADGTSSTQAVGGADGAPRFVWETVAPTPTPTQRGPQEPTEIDPNNLQDLNRLRPATRTPRA